MILLDLFCKAGGAGTGYSMAGLQVVGVDIEPQPHYPFEFYQADALEFCALHGREFDIIHASPPCQLYSVTASLTTTAYPDLIPDTRKALQATGRPFIIENVPGSPLENPLLLCGTMFGLQVQRHRLFECNPVIWFSPYTCQHVGMATGNHKRRHLGTSTPCFNDGYTYITVAGNNYLAAEGRRAMGIDWMTKKELSQAIPPAYTEFVGRTIISLIEGNHASRDLRQS